MARRRGLPLLDLQEIFLHEEQRDGLVLVTEGNTTQRLERRHQGRPEVLLSVQVAPGRQQHIADAIYAYLDREPVAQRLAFDGCHPNAEGHRLIARHLARAILALETPAAPASEPTPPRP